MKTSALKKAIKPIVNDEYNKLNGTDRPVSISQWTTNVAIRLKKELDLNEFAQEIAARECQESAHARTGDYPLVQDMLLPGFNDDELKSKGFRFGKDSFVSLWAATAEHINLRLMNQIDHHLASATTLQLTKQVMDSEIYKLMKANPTLGFGKAKEQWLNQ